MKLPNPARIVLALVLSAAVLISQRSLPVTPQEIGPGAAPVWDNTSKSFWMYYGNGIWTEVGKPIPIGAILISLAACPAGWSEVASLNGRGLVGTLAANSNVTGTGGADLVTPTFTGSALATHAHELPIQIASATLMRQTASFGNGTARAATSQQTHTANTTSAAVALSQAISGGTPAGTISQIDNRAAFTRVIFCQAN